MTTKKLYTFLMNDAIFGILGLLVLFILSFFAVHIIKLAKIGYRAQKTPTQPKPKREEVKKEAPPKQSLGEPVYYIVERKRRTKSSYSAPKEIRFK